MPEPKPLTQAIATVQAAADGWKRANDRAEAAEARVRELEAKNVQS
jgi:hypothetical protein